MNTPVSHSSSTNRPNAPGLLRAFWIVFRKEVRDNIRDRRTVFSALGMTVATPLLFVGLMSFVLQQAIEDAEDPLDLAVVGAELAPNLMAFLVRNNVSVQPGPDDPEQAVRSRSHNVVLVVSEDYAERLAAGQPAGLRLVHDSSRQQSSLRDYRRARGLLHSFSGQLASLRLQARGVNPQVVQPLRVASSDVASPSARALSLLGMIPYFVILSVFMGGFYLAIDTTAGEREQGTLEPLLAQPVDRGVLALGKLAATALFSTITLVLVLLAFNLVIGFVPLEDLGMSVQIGLWKVLLLVLGVLPLVLLASAVMMVVASFTRSFKEAQTWLSFVLLVPTMPLLLVAFMAPQPSLWTMMVPSLSQALLINEIVKGDSVAPALLAMSAGSTLLLGAVLSWVAVSLYRRERLLG